MKTSNTTPRPRSQREIRASTVGFTLDGTSQKVLPVNLNRAYILIQNRSANSIFVAIGNTIDSANFNCFEIVAGGNYEPPTNGLKILTSDIYIKGGLANSNIAITEGIFI